MKITPEFLSDIKSKAQAATSGPWMNPARSLVVSVDRDEEPVVCDVIGDNSKNDISYIIAVSPNKILALVEYIDKLETGAIQLASKLGGYDCDTNADYWLGMVNLDNLKDSWKDE